MAISDDRPVPRKSDLARLHPDRAANIDGDGVLLAPFQSNNRDQAEIVPICRVAELVEQLKRLADDLQLSDDETKSMFAEARKWINDDARARTPVEKANLTEI